MLVLSSQCLRYSDRREARVLSSIPAKQWMLQGAKPLDPAAVNWDHWQRPQLSSSLQSFDLASSSHISPGDIAVCPAGSRFWDSIMSEANAT